MTARRPCGLDHVVVTASDLAAGVYWVESMLGVALQTGGEHQRMATHNALLRLGDSTYLEVIAPNPAALHPDGPRWFELDRLSAEESPRLATWVARTDDIYGATTACRGEFGDIEPMSRGSLNWLITIPAQGALLAGGVIPMLIEWRTAKHPAAALEDKGCALSQLELFHPNPKAVSKILDCLAIRPEVGIHQAATGTRPYLVAHIDTPQGLRSIGASRDQGE
jgi:glyoxalase-like protein